MKGALAPFALAATLMACETAPPITDLRLEDVRAATEADRADFESRYTRPDSRPRLGLLVTVSTSIDLRERQRRFGAVSDLVEQCRGRSQLAGTPRRHMLRTAGLRDDIGPLSDPNLPERPLLPVEGRLRYRVPILPQTLGAVFRHGGTGEVHHATADSDLRRDREDLCVLVDGVHSKSIFHPPWTSNTVVVPHGVIRAALADVPP